MENINRILVTSRSSEDCKHVIHYGADLARAFSAQLSILHIEYDPFESLTFRHVSGRALLREDFQARAAEIRQEIDSCIRDVRAIDGMTISEMVQRGEPVEETIKAVEKYTIDLVLIAALPQGRLERFVYGRSNHELLRRLPCSIFFVKGE